MFCTKCGAQFDDSIAFCPNCGQPNPAAAPQANAQQPYGAQPVYGAQPTYGTQPAGGPVSFGQRNIAVAIILSIVTCGIYGIIWMISLVDNLNEASGEPNNTSGGMVCLLSIVTCGIYQWIWLYKAGESVSKAKAMRGMDATNNGTMYLVLSLFGLGIVSWCLIQSELNKIAEYYGAPKA